ncbi:MAG: hypothetical protein SGBAC_012882, partial [Bacillariaceae sp.]
MLAESDLKNEFIQQKIGESGGARAIRKESFWDRNRRIAESLLDRNDDERLVRKIITAYLEPQMNDTVPGTGDQGNPKREIDKGSPPEFYEPLPLRQTTPQDLKKYEYPKFRTCHDLPAKLPVDRGLQFDKEGNVVVHNVGNAPTPDDYPWQEAPHCPVDADPFLPWIHDVFPSLDGKRVEFVAQNKRRCQSGSVYRKDILRMTPQVALLQPISVEVIDEQKAQRLAPELWSEPNNHDTTSGPSMPRYRLAPYEEASPEGMWTRFICRFHSTDFESGKPNILKETLSEYPINYELAGYRKNRPQLLTPKGRETNLFWTSTLLFSCPIPPELQSLVLDGSTILSDGTPTLHVDVVPIRTSPRYGSKEVYFTEDMVGPRKRWETSGNLDTFNSSGITSNGFNATQRWGHQHVLPPVEASGRWANLPICAPPTIPFDEKHEEVAKNVKEDTNSKEIKLKESVPLRKEKPHQLTACLWSAASFSERGIKDNRNKQKDTIERLREWIEFHLLVGFDHIVVYDNSGAHTNDTSLEPITSQYPSSKVTRVDWPSLVCNNNIPGHPNTGERSSQYAAENSCRTRYGPYTEWMASFDTDEYLVPMGNYTNLKDVVRDAAKGGTNILSFRSTRGKLRHDFTRESEYHEKKRDGVIKTPILDKADNVTFLEAYNCDSSPLPKPKYADRAKKQIYRTDYVLNHFVHYSTVTKPYMEHYRDTMLKGKKWQR